MGAHFYGIHLVGDSLGLRSRCGSGGSLESSAAQQELASPSGDSICLTRRKGVGREENILGSGGAT